MKTIDYINSLIKERDEFKELCKKNVEIIHLMKKDLMKLNSIISKKDKSIQKLENESINIKTKNELEKVKSELKKIKIDYKDLQSKYDTVIAENAEFKRIFDDIENTCDGD